MYTRRGKKALSTCDSQDIAEQHQKFVQKMQNPDLLDGEIDGVDGNTLKTGNGHIMERSFHLDELPDGHHISPAKAVRKDGKSMQEVRYIGSFCVMGEDQDTRAQHVKTRLAEMNVELKSKPVMLVISVSGIKVCSHSGDSVFMAHALKRISYATCDPDLCQFAFLAREPKAATNLQYCHTFVTDTAEEAEELNSIVGNSFKAAYSENHTEEESQNTSQLTFQELIEQQISEKKIKEDEIEQKKQQQLKNRLSLISTPTVDEQLKERNEQKKKHQEETDKQRAEEVLKGKDRPHWAKQIAGRTKHKAPYLDYTGTPATPNPTPESTIDSISSSINISSPRASITSIDPHASPQKMRTLTEIQKVISAGEMRSYGSPVMSLKETIDRRYEMETETLRIVGNDTNTKTNTGATGPSPFVNRPLPAKPGESSRQQSTASQCEKSTMSSETLSPDEDLENCAWYQASLPRHVALDLLGHQEIGSFIVRNSASNIGCFALSVRVPHTDNAIGINHYLIQRTTEEGDYKLKGVDKDWPTLSALVTHLTVMNELLPCTLVLPKNASNPAFNEAEHDREDDEDEDYKKFSDCKAMMQELKM